MTSVLTSGAAIAHVEDVTSPELVNYTVTSTTFYSGTGPFNITDADMRRLEQENILRALQQTRWKIFGLGGAAELLGIKQTTLVSRIRKLGLTTPRTAERGERGDRT